MNREVRKKKKIKKSIVKPIANINSGIRKTREHGCTRFSYALIKREDRIKIKERKRRRRPLWSIDHIFPNVNYDDYVASLTPQQLIEKIKNKKTEIPSSGYVSHGPLTLNWDNYYKYLFELRVKRTEPQPKYPIKYSDAWNRKHRKVTFRNILRLSWEERGNELEILTISITLITAGIITKDIEYLMKEYLVGYFKEL